MTGPQLTPHPVTCLFPAMSADEYAALKADLAAHGQHEPVWTWQGQIIDGRHRYRACIELELKPNTCEWDGQGSLVAFVVGLNLHRRHLSSSQKAMIALEVERQLAEEAKARQRLSGGRGQKGSQRIDPAARLKGKAAEQAARLTGTNRQYVADAKRLAAEAPDVAERVRAGELTLPEAKVVARLPEEKRPLVFERVASGQVKGIKEAVRAVSREQKRETAVASPVVGERYRLLCGDFAQVAAEIAPGSVDAIITDPPYPEEYLPLYDVLAREGARLLKPGGVAVVMTAHYTLPEVLGRMTPHLRYHWLIAYVTPRSEARVFSRKALVGWKPVLVFTNGDYAGEWFTDTVESAGPDKRFHAWGQSESGMAALVECFTRPGELVLDPFVGGGATGIAALKLGRRFVGVDMDAAAVATCAARLANMSPDAIVAAQGREGQSSTSNGHHAR